MKKILIVEDDVAIAEIERDYLEIQGFAVEIASDGKAGLELAQNGSFSLIILDVMLPEIDGFSLCRTLREKLDIPIIMVTARKDDIDKIRGLGLGADDYVVKPFSPGELVARVRSHIAAYERIANGTSHGNARTAESESPEITFGNLRLVQKSRRVFVSEKEIPLAKKEFDLLSLFMQNPDRVFSKEELYGRLWNDESSGDIATVAVHINRLREKLSDSTNKIETVWGAGYRFQR